MVVRGVARLALVHLLLVGCMVNDPVNAPAPAPVKMSQTGAEHDTTVHAPFNSRIDGISFSAPPHRVGREVFDSMAVVGAEWVAIVPYAYGPGDDGRLFWQGVDRQWWGESEVGTREQIRLAKDAGSKVMVKPHLWLQHGGFTGSYQAQDWEAFSASYRDYLLTYARMAAEEGVELLCIGTELRSFTQARPAFWNALIDTVRSMYSGKLTYAANWDEVAHVPFWSQLDAIGVDGYFPLTERATNDVDTIAAGWARHIELLHDLSRRTGRRVLFTELGYTCTTHCTVEPWKEDRAAQRDEIAQAAAYAAFFRTVHAQDWYVGSFVWKWFADGGAHEERRGNGFSPQGKAALSVLKTAYTQ